jgi:hypothetical protein
MIVETIAAGAIAVLGPYLAEAGKGFAKKAGESLAEKAGNLYGIIKAKFAGDDDAEQALALLKAEPGSKGRLLVLEEVLTKKIADDPDFAATLNTLIEEARRSDVNNVMSIGERSVAIGRDATGSTIITGNNNEVGKS